MPTMAGVPFPPLGKSSVADPALVSGPAHKQGHAHPRKQSQDVDRALVTDAQAVFKARAIQPLMQAAFPYCPKTRACTFSSRLTVIVTQDSTQALAAFDRAVPWERIEVGPDDLVLQPLVVSFLVIMEEEI